MSVRIAINAGLFEVMAREDSKPRSAWHLAEIINADPVLLGKTSPKHECRPQD